MSSGGGSAGRATTGAIRIGNTISAAVSNHRVMEPVEARIMTLIGALLLGFETLIFFFPRVLTYPVIAVSTWIAVALLYRGCKLYRLRRKQRRR